MGVISTLISHAQPLGSVFSPKHQKSIERIVQLSPCCTLRAPSNFHDGKYDIWDVEGNEIASDYDINELVRKALAFLEAKALEPVVVPETIQLLFREIVRETEGLREDLDKITAGITQLIARHKVELLAAKKQAWDEGFEAALRSYSNVPGAVFVNDMHEDIERFNTKEKNFYAD